MIENIYDDETPKVVKVKKTIIETPTVKTFIFPWKITDDIHSGQFVMVWDLNTEKPMSISVIDRENNLLGITVRKAGPFTNNMYDNINEGDYIGIRGPYGHGYETKEYKRILAVGGGSGIASLASIVEKYNSDLLTDIEIICAASTEEELVFEDRFSKLNCKLHICTDDGTKGFKGFSTQLAEQLLKSEQYDLIIGCGPEIMLYKLYELSRQYKVDCQISLDRYMKCGLGICGQCCVDNTGSRVCVEGPVFDKNQLKQITEFGKYRRTASGKKFNF